MPLPLTKISYPSKTRVALALFLAIMPLSAAQSQIAVTSNPPQAGTEMKPDEPSQLILQRYRRVLLDGKAPDWDKVRVWAATLGANGQWSDIDYKHQARGAWKTSMHLDRVRILSRALVDPKSPLLNDPKVEAATLSALDHWVANRYKNPNWWHNDIGVPMMMRDTLILLGDRLQGERRTGALQVLNQYGRPKAGDGANTVWQAELGLEYGALTGDTALIARNSQMISDEIKITRAEGIQSDFSFHAHKQRLQQFHYGGVFLSEPARLGWQLSGTPWALPQQKLEILADYVLQGGQWMVRGTATVPGTLDRAASRPNSLQGGDMRRAIRYLREALPERAQELDKVLARQEGTAPPLVGFRAFPRSDFTTYHRPTFSFFLKTISDRTLLTEFGLNSENLKGQKLNVGDHYLLRDGQEYNNLQPLWDWDLLPGVTWAKGAGNVQRQPFVGAIGDGSSGATAMDYRFAGKEGQSLSARKFWATHGDTIVCLIGDLKTTGITEPVRTALDQSLLRGPVIVSDAADTLKTLSPSPAKAQPLQWIHHAGFAYIPLGALPITMQLGPVIGTWSSINQGGPSDPVTNPVFLPILEHGTAPQGQSSGFVIAPVDTSQQAANLASQPIWQVLQNDANCQAVRFADGTIMSAFYAPGKLENGGQMLFEVDKPCLVIWRNGQIHLCDPTQKGGSVTLRTQGKEAVTVQLPPGGQGIIAQG